MLFVVLTFLAAFSIESLGTYVSVIGLSTLFGANPVIIALAVALDVGKLIVVSLLYKYWKKLGVAMRAYAFVAAVIMMTITSAGTAGYLSGEFQKAIVGTQEVSLSVDTMKAQIAKYEERKKQIDDQIAAIPEKYTANQRIRLMNQFKAEQTDLQAKIAKLDEELPAMQAKQIGVEAKAGPILYIAKAFQIPVEEAVKWVILMITFVFDPLAVFLVIAGNFLLEQRKARPEAEDVEEAPVLPPPEYIVPPVIVPTAGPVPVPVKASEPTPAQELTLEPLAPAPAPEPEPEIHPARRMTTNANGVRVMAPVREEITLSSLGVVKPDPNTITDVGALSPGSRPDIFPPRG